MSAWIPHHVNELAARKKSFYVTHVLENHRVLETQTFALAFLVLGYLVVKSIELPLGEYLRQSWGMIGCCAAGAAAGLAVSLAIPHAGDLVRMIAVGGTSIVVMLTLVVTWQKITPKSIKAALQG